MASVSNCNFTTTVKWEGDAAASVHAVAKALLNLTELFKHQGVECILKMETETEKTKNKKKAR